MFFSLFLHRWLRSLRGWAYRRIPPTRKEWSLKRFAGYERRWNLEIEGFTKEGFFRILQKNILARVRSGDFYELVAGDGQVGSLGIWLERRGGWRVEAWEHRAYPLAAFRENRTKTKIHGERLTNWGEKERKANPAGITSRGMRESAGICREIRKGGIRPGFVGIWNPSRRPVWMHRLGRAGYRLELIYERMEFYRDRR
ncbi:MAG: hypothetical protein EBV83_08925 [Verrucomicrobia bacterium]|nr:hypothetical protein [Verrucomicrobiota bacterium]